MTAASHCHELSRQSLSRPRPSPRACACAGAPACMGINWHCRVSSQQCESVVSCRWHFQLENGRLYLAMTDRQQ